MGTRAGRFVTGALVVALVGCAGADDAPPRQASIGALSIRAARIPESPGGERLAVYAEIQNGGADDALVGLRAGIAGEASLHVMESADGMMIMRPTESLPVGEGETLSLRTGGVHGMLEQLVRVPVPGDVVEVTFVFASGMEVLVAVPVVPLADIVGGR